MRLSTWITACVLAGAAFARTQDATPATDTSATTTRTNRQGRATRTGSLRPASAGAGSARPVNAGPSRPARRELINSFSPQSAKPAALPAELPTGAEALAPQAPPTPNPWAGYGIEAPTQPNTKSTATYERGPRVAPIVQHSISGRAITTSIETICDVRGQEDNDIFGIGLVTGLAGTGDSPNMTRQLVDNVLRSSNIRIDVNNLAPKNVAFVRIEAKLPPGVQPGRRIDVRVSTLGDCKSLQGGTLLFAELTDTGGIVYATASGPVDVGGFLIEGAAASVSKNHVTVGTIAGGAKVERAVTVDIVSDHGYIYFDLRPSQSSFTNLVRITDAVNNIYPAAAEAATDGRTVKVHVPEGLPQSAHVAFLESILSLEVQPDVQPYVVINERTGTIVMGEGVRLRPGAVAMGSLTVSVAESPETSQPGAQSGGDTTTNPRTDVTVSEGNNGLVEVPGAVSLQEVVDVLNILGLSPRELIMILDAMHQAGMLLAEVRRL